MAWWMLGGGMLDLDGDGWSLFVDCDDWDASVYPGAPEGIADGVDSDCDSLESCYLDADLDGFGSSTVVPSADLDCFDLAESSSSTDCADADTAISPGAVEVVADGVDQTCDGREWCWLDLDGDGYGSSAVTESLDVDCTDFGESDASTDCDDTTVEVYPGAPERPADGRDQSCDGLEDCFVDADSDGYGGGAVTGSSDFTCASGGVSPVGTDCDDGAWSAYPGAYEVPGDEIDEDCDATELCFADADADGARGEQVTPSDDADCDDPGEFAADDPPDCDDADPTRAPGANELCNGVDDDCDGIVDLDGCSPDDADSDGVLDAIEDGLCTVLGRSGCGLDPDLDQDAVIDGVELGDPSAPTDTDGDGIADWVDPDDDDDGQPSRRENGLQCGGVLEGVLDPAGYWTFTCYGQVYDFGSNALDALPDTDDDGLPDLRDPDDDGDGVPTAEEGSGDADCDALPNHLDPVDGDGPCAPSEPLPADTGGEFDTATADPGEKPPPPPSSGCGCAHGGVDGGWLGFALVGATAARSRPPAHRRRSPGRR